MTIKLFMLLIKREHEPMQIRHTSRPGAVVNGRSKRHHAKHNAVPTTAAGAGQPFLQ